MATPNQNPNTANKQLQSYAAHAVSTPNQHFGSSPNITTPRSVPSPALSRHTAAAAKHAASSAANTPVHHGVGVGVDAGANKAPMSSSQHSQSGGGSSGGIAMAPSLSQISNTSTGSMGAPIGLGVSSGSGGLLGASPANLLSFASPAALAGIDLGTPSGLLGEGGHAMNLSLSDLGLSSRRGNEDEERRARLETVLLRLQGRKNKRAAGGERIVGGRFGRVSEEGVRRVGCWVGMDIDIAEKERKLEGNRQITVAGKSAVMIDITFKHNLPTALDVSFFSEDEAVLAHQEAASKVLLRDLTPPPGIATINTKLDRFAANLETIAKLDRLSISGQLNCFEAMTGIYTSLQKLYEHEKKAALTLLEAKQGDKETMAEREVMCKKSGRPRMHARRKIGLSVEYWMSRRHLPAKSNSAPAAPKDEGEMDLDPPFGPAPENHEDDNSNNARDIYTVTLTTEANDPTLYPSLRTSHDWTSPRILVPDAETTSPTALISGNPSIDWQDPPSTYLTSDDSADAGNQQNSQKLPSVRFVAELDPPLVLPWAVANNLLQSVGAQAGTDFDGLQTYTSILLKRSASARNNTNISAVGGTSPVASAEKTVLSRKRRRGDGEGGGEEQVQQKTDLWVPKQEFGYVLRSFPFAHPRQIIQMLPTLRQWAQVGSLLQGAFLAAYAAADDDDAPAALTSATTLPAAGPTTSGSKKAGEGKKMFTLAELLTPPESSDEDTEMIDANSNAHVSAASNQGPLPVDISLTTSPSPALDIVFPLPKLACGLASVSVGLLGDGEIVVLGQNLVDNEPEMSGQGLDDDGDVQQQDQERGRRVRKLARALEVVGDVGVWVEWMRSEFGAS